MPTTINFSGLGSSIQWGDIVDATIEAEKARNLTPITDEITKRQAQRDAWTKMQSLVETLNDSATPGPSHGVWRVYREHPPKSYHVANAALSNADVKCRAWAIPR